MIEQQTATKRRGGRPSREEAEKIEDKILDAAAWLFFKEGYGAVSIETIARRAAISKRTFYARFDGKEVLFRAVVHSIINRLRPSGSDTDHLFEGDDVETVLRRIAPLILQGALMPATLALYRVVLAESNRFPELALILSEQGTRQEAIQRIAALLRKNPAIRIDPVFAAEQFLALLTAAPQRRALGLGVAMNEKELQQWQNQTVDLFLQGCGKSSPPPTRAGGEPDRSFD